MSTSRTISLAVYLAEQRINVLVDLRRARLLHAAQPPSSRVREIHDSRRPTDEERRGVERDAFGRHDASGGRRTQRQDPR